MRSKQTEIEIETKREETQREGEGERHNIRSFADYNRPDIATEAHASQIDKDYG